MRLVFKEHRSATPTQAMQSWISPDGDMAVLASFAEDVDREAFLLALEDAAELIDPSETSTVLNILKETAGSLGRCNAVSAIWLNGEQVSWSLQGRSSLIRVNSQVAEFVAESQGSRKLEPGTYYMLYQGDAAEKQVRKVAFSLEQESSVFVQNAFDNAGQKSPWQALVFPVEESISYIHPDWPYDPFVGFQESESHERLGLRLLADALFKSRQFDGFRIVGGHHIARAQSSRMIDGMLISPWGVFLLELKHVRGDIVLEAENRNAGMRINRQGHVRRDTNPASKVEEALRQQVKGMELGVNLDVQLRNRGILLFTHPRSHVKVLRQSGKYDSLPCTTGAVLVATPKNVAGLIVSEYAASQSRGGKQGKNLRPPIDGATIKTIAHRLDQGRVEAASGSQQQSSRKFGRFVVESKPIAAESGESVSVFPARIEGKDSSLWAKRFSLSSMGKRDSLDGEISRVGREVSALQDLAGRPGIQRYWDRFVDGLDLYILVEAPKGMTLDRWVEECAPSRERRIAVLARLGEAMSHLAKEGIVHRAIKPFNVRVDADDQPTLINFDLCQIGWSATVDAASRQRLDSAFLSREALTPGAKLGPADDAFSFGKLACLLLAGKLPFDDAGEQIKFQAKPKNWADFAESSGLGEQELEDIKALLSIDPSKRPVGDDLVRRVNRWV